jgi:hypothetical protein
MLQVLQAVAKTRLARPDLVLTASNGRCVIGAAKTALVEQTGVSKETWDSRFLRTRQVMAQEWEAACYGEFDAEAIHQPLRIAGVTARYLLTAAQDNTPVHEPFWLNLLAFAKHIGAEVMVGGFTYQKGLFEDHAARAAVFAEAVRPHLRHEQVRLSADILFCAEMNTLPTAVRPLSGLDTYTQGRWGVFPHAKIQLVSVPTHFTKHAAMLMTTGACTVPNYVAKKAGLKAAFHHILGATLVEIDPSGRVFCRQISATDDGSFQDLDLKVRNQTVTKGHRIEAMTPGDIHVEKIDPVVAKTIWGIDVAKMERVTPDCMIDVLRPRFQFAHDLIDFAARNHHRRGDHLFRFQTYIAGEASIDRAFARGARFLRASERDFCQTAIIPSNHNDAFPRWLREGDPREDEVNARLWFQANDALYAAAERGDGAFDVVRWALGRHDADGLESIVFPPRDASFLICQDHGGIECNYHGDKGPNGARGSPQALSRVAMRLNTGHTHSASILDGVYTAGLSGLMDQGYNSDSPSSWSHSLIITYPNGKRTICTIRDGHWRAA